MTEEEVVEIAQTRRGWTPERARDAVRRIMATNKWSLESLYIGLRADFKCEYCGRDLLGSPADYKLWETDHVVPGNGDTPDNLALACTVCNCKFKNSWWRPDETSTPKERNVRIEEVRQYIEQRRAETAKEVEYLKQILT
jgi:5-methylcytosine-specific restriction endonuclease McrA